MTNVIGSAIDAVQAINESVVSHRKIKAPCLAEYPPVVDSARCPIILTHTEPSSFSGQFSERANLQIVSRMLFKPITQGQFGDTMNRIYEAMDDLRAHYSNENNYAIVGRRVLQTSPVAVEVTSNFELSGYQVLEYPLGSDMWYHGFEFRFTVETNSGLENC